MASAINGVKGRDQFSVLGTRIDAVQIPDAVAIIESWIAAGTRGSYVAAANVHMTIEAVQSESFASVLSNASMVVADGMPLIWLGRRQGFVLPRRVYGPDLMMHFLRSTQGRGYRHFFFGGAPGVAEKLVTNLQSQMDVNCVGTVSPPFRTLSPAEDQEVVDSINSARPDIIWVCLGCPKQERWMFEHSTKIEAAAMVGVGQAFDIHAGNLRQAPRIMRENGLEWLFRLCIEPRRLWRRYLIYNSKFIYYNVLQQLGLRDF
jgi:N-acetylglucosaminyldiphosphoundecaprenol N-acetyl-beta-D-mannosaminyltransferase